MKRQELFSLYRMYGGQHPDAAVERLVFADPGNMSWCLDHAAMFDLREAIEKLLIMATVDRVTTPCPCGAGMAALVEVPHGTQGYFLSEAALVCEECLERYRGYGYFALSLRGLFNFCDAEWRRGERKAMGRLLANAFGIERITEKNALRFFHDSRPAVAAANSNDISKEVEVKAKRRRPRFPSLISDSVRKSG